MDHRCFAALLLCCFAALLLCCFAALLLCCFAALLLCSGALRIATYNVENLFDHVDDPALVDNNDDLPMAKPEAQCRAIADTISAIDADVIALEEIESLDALVWFRDTYLSDRGYEYIASIDAGDGRGIENGVISRVPISNPKTWVGLELGGVHPATFGDRGAENWFAGQPLKFRRTPLRIDVDVPPGTELAGELTTAPISLTLFVIHHKSGRGSEYWREAEAAKVVELISEAQKERPGRPIALLGDFNAAPADKVLDIYRQAGLIDTLARRDTDGPTAATFLTHASSRTIDYILVDPSLATELVPDSAFVFATPILPKDLDYRDTAPPPGYASDHMPVCVEVRPSLGKGTVKGEEGAKAGSGE
jgi:endonuclease/exonuclease/phosphatase family metal-dependent hydrolase